MSANKYGTVDVQLDDPDNDSLTHPSSAGENSGKQLTSSRKSEEKKREKQRYSGSMLNRWPRAFARLLDLSWQMPLVMSTLLLLASGQLTAGITSDWLLFIMVAFVSLPIALLLDALIAGIFSNTPAKAIIGVKAVSSRGERLYFGKHLKRNIGVWTDGMALGLIPISLFTLVKQYKRVSGRRETIYDEKLHVRVRSGRFTAVRVVLLLLIAIGATVGLTIFAN